jgi:hypothetical protein
VRCSQPLFDTSDRTVSVVGFATSKSPHRQPKSLREFIQVVQTEVAFSSFYAADVGSMQSCLFARVSWEQPLKVRRRRRRLAKRWRVVWGSSVGSGPGLGTPRTAAAMALAGGGAREDGGRLGAELIAQDAKAIIGGQDEGTPCDFSLLHPPYRSVK